MYRFFNCRTLWIKRLSLVWVFASFFMVCSLIFVHGTIPIRDTGFTAYFDSSINSSYAWKQLDTLTIEEIIKDGPKFVTENDRTSLIITFKFDNRYREKYKNFKFNFSEEFYKRFAGELADLSGWIASPVDTVFNNNEEYTLINFKTKGEADFVKLYSVKKAN